MGRSRATGQTARSNEAYGTTKTRTQRREGENDVPTLGEPLRTPRSSRHVRVLSDHIALTKFASDLRIEERELEAGGVN